MTKRKTENPSEKKLADYQKSTERRDDLEKTRKDKENRISELVRNLLAPHKTVRDAIHKDILITHLETMIIDTSDFQRIRRLRQLGLTNLVYPSANHTRFEHSLGSLFMADLMVEKINKNPYARKIIGSEDRFIIRLCSLLHDVANIPFGHTLEDEGGLDDSKWSEKASELEELDDSQWSELRLKRFLGDGSSIGKIILEYPVLQQLAALGQTRFVPKSVLAEIRKTLSCIEAKKVETLDRPYIGDIVGNTICADLLDYSKRDVYFTGLTSGFDERFLSYIYVDEFRKKDRLVWRLIKPKTGMIRRDVLSELMDLLRIRYSLAERVYYQHTKMIASAMLISAVNAMVQEKKLTVEKLYDMDDDTLLEYLFSSGNAIAKHLVSRIRERKIYKIAYDLSYAEEGVGRNEENRKSDIITELTQPELRYKRERVLECMNAASDIISKTPGSIVIYCPGKKMGMKEIEALVDWGKRIDPLRNIGDRRIRAEIKTSITDKHRELWKMFVLVDPDVPIDERCHINGDCEELFGLPSDSKTYKAKMHTHYIDRIAVRYEREKGTRLLREEVAAIKTQIPTRGPDRGEVVSYAEFCNEIDNLRATAGDEKAPKP